MRHRAGVGHHGHTRRRDGADVGARHSRRPGVVVPVERVDSEGHRAWSDDALASRGGRAPDAGLRAGVVHRDCQRDRRAHRPWFPRLGRASRARASGAPVSRDPDVRADRHRRRAPCHGGPGRPVGARRSRLCDVHSQVAESAADARVRARAQWSSGESFCPTRSTAGRGCCARRSWCSRPRPSPCSWPARRASRRRPNPKPIEREASASRADVVMSACFAAVGAAGLALSLLLTGRPSVFPRIAFGATFGCHFCSSLCRGASSRPANRRDGRRREAAHISSESPGSCFSSPTRGSSAWSSAPRHRRSCICGGTRRNRGARRSR